MIIGAVRVSKLGLRGFVLAICSGLSLRIRGKEARGLKLLREWLSPQQFSQYDAKSYFEVIGCHSGKRFRISHGISMNVHELDGAGRPRVGWCFAPKGSLAAGDVSGALAVANYFPVQSNC
jgi:hypothetical protein